MPLVAAAFGMDPEATMIYIADHVDPGRLPNRMKTAGEVTRRTR